MAWHRRLPAALPAPADGFVPRLPRALTGPLAVPGSDAIARRSRLIVFLASSLLGFAALVFYGSQDFTMVQGDSIGHLFIARRMIDSVTPSFSALGGIWLPLPHILMLPTIWNRWMWTSGMSGSIISFAAFVLAAVYVHETVRDLTKSALAGMLSAALFATNPNVLFMQTTAMLEILTIFLTLGATYHLIRFTRTTSNVHLIASAAFVFAATLTRYECWFLVPAGVAIVAFTSYRRNRRLVEAEAYTIAWGFFASYGIVLWLVYCQIIFGDYLNFARGFGTAAALADELQAVGRLPFKGDLWLSNVTYGWAIIDNAGLPFVAAGVLGLGALGISRIPLSVKVAALLPLAIYVFQIVALYAGHSPLATPQTLEYFENVRYGILMLPALAILAGCLAAPLRSLGVVLLSLVLLPQLLALPQTFNVPSFMREQVNGHDRPSVSQAWMDDNFPFLRGDQPVVVVDAVLAGGLVDLAQEAGEWVGANVGDGKILVSTTRNDAALLMMDSGFNASRFIHEANDPYFHEELDAFGTHADWVIAQPRWHNDNVSPRLARAEPPGFQLVYDNTQFQVYKRFGPPDDLFDRPAAVPDTAGRVSENRLLGVPVGGLPTDVLHVLESRSCDGGLLRLSTNREVLYAEIPCDGLAEMLAPLVWQPVRITLDGAGRVDLEGANGERVLLEATRTWMDMENGKPVPPSAQLLREPAVIGALSEPESDGAIPRTLAAIECSHEVVRVRTNREAILGEFHCPDLPPWRGLEGQRVQVTATIDGEDRALHVESQDGGALTLATGRIWIDHPRPERVTNTARSIDYPFDSWSYDPNARVSERPVFYNVECENDTASLISTRETVYFGYPCSQIGDHDAFKRQPVHFQVEPGTTGSTLIVTSGDLREELDADHVWVDVRSRDRE